MAARALITPPRPVQRALVIGPSAVALALVATVGAPIDLLLAAALAPWVVALRPKVGWAAAAALSGLGALTAAAAVASLSAPLGLGLVEAQMGVAMGAVVILGVSPLGALQLPVPGRRDWVMLAAAVAGGGAWIAAVATSVQSRATIAWAMQGDFALNTSVARWYLTQGGVDLFPTANPRPLEHVIVATLTGPGHHPSLASATRLELEVHATAHAWAWAVAAVCFFSAVLAARTCGAAGDRGRNWAPLAALLASLAPLGPITLGDAIALGHLNTFVAAATMLAALVVATSPAASPAARATGAALAATVLALVWTPLAVVPGALWLLAIVPWWRDRSATPVLGTAGVVGSAIVGAALVGAHVVADMLGVGGPAAGPSPVDTVALAGYFIYHPTVWGLTAAAGVALCAVLLRDRVASAAEPMIVAVAAMMAGLGVLLAAQGSLAEPWRYYPSKYLAIVVVTLAGPAVGWAVAAMLTAIAAPRERWRAGAAGLALAACLGGALTAFNPRIVRADNLPTARIQDPYRYGGDNFVDRVYAATTDDAYVVYWRFGARDRLVNHVVGTTTLHPRRGAEFGEAWYRARFERDWRSAEELCEAAAEAPLPTVAITADAALAGEVRALCPDLGIDVRTVDGS